MEITFVEYSSLLDLLRYLTHPLLCILHMLPNFGLVAKNCVHLSLLWLLL